jgi:hypothetical protein
MRIIATFYAFCISGNSVVHGWSAGAHQKIASVAFDYLSDPTREAFQALLPRGKELREWMVDGSTWADTDGRDAGDNHFVHISSCNPAVMRLQCGDRGSDGTKCITKALHRHINGAFSQTRNEALLESFKYLIHYMADIHQPLHVALKRDLGGNNIEGIRPFKAFNPVSKRERPVDLHEVWDFTLFDIANSKRMFSEGFPSAPSTPLDFSPRHLATPKAALDQLELMALETAAEVTCGFTYWSNDFEARTFTTMRSGTYLSDAYIAQGKLEVVKQVERAGLRLASLIESIFVHRIEKARVTAAAAKARIVSAEATAGAGPTAV